MMITFVLFLIFLPLETVANITAPLAPYPGQSKHQGNLLALSSAVGLFLLVLLEIMFGRIHSQLAWKIFFWTPHNPIARAFRGRALRLAVHLRCCERIWLEDFLPSAL